MAERSDSLGNIDLEGIFSDIDSGLQEMKEADEIIILPEEQTEFEIQWLNHFFPRQIRGDLRVLIDDFPQLFVLNRNRTLFDPQTDERTKKKIENISLENLAKTAEKEFERYVKQAGLASNLELAKIYQTQADRWGRIYQIVKGVWENEK